MKEMEKAVLSYKKGECTQQKAINAVLSAIFRNRSYFKLEKLNDDNFSDYLLYFQERLPRFMDMYDPEKSLFRTYIRKICMTQLRSWYRRFYRHYARDMALTTYAIEEGISTLTSADYETPFSADETDSTSNELIDFLKQINKKIPIQTKIMMLALKSASFLTPGHITRICQIAEISEDELLHKLEIINSKINVKIKRQQHLLQLQNEAYIIKKESGIQMSVLNPDSSHYRDAEVSRDFHDKLWKSRIDRTRATHDVYPTNSLVSEVLDVPLGQVTHVFSAVRHKMGGSNIQKEVSYEHDDLCSDRKPSQEERITGNIDTTSGKDSKR